MMRYEGMLPVGLVASGHQAAQAQDLLSIRDISGRAAHRLQAILQRRVEARQRKLLQPMIPLTRKSEEV